MSKVIQWLAHLLFWQLLIDTSAAYGLATVTPCPDCGLSIAPKPITITAQYQAVATCKPSEKTQLFPYTKRYAVTTVSKVKTVASCRAYLWVSSTIPAYCHGTKTSTVVTTTNQPITFSSQRYTETHTTTMKMRQASRYPHGDKSTTKVSHKTIDIKKYCDYDSIGPLAIPGYKGSGLCKDCGPDARYALTQRLTVVSCVNKHCTTFNETWIAQLRTYSKYGIRHTATTTNIYCPTATPVSMMPGYTKPAPYGPVTGKPAPPYYPGHSQDGTPNSYGHGSEYAAAKPTGKYQPDGYSSSPNDAPGHGGHSEKPGHYSDSKPYPDGYESKPYPDGYASKPADGYETKPADGYETKPADGYDPKPTNGYEPAPTYGHEPTPTDDYQPTPTDDYQSTPTDDYQPTPTDYYQSTTTDEYEPHTTDYGGPDPSSDPSADLGYNEAVPTVWRRAPDAHQVYKRKGIEGPRGQVIKRGGLLFWGN